MTLHDHAFTNLSYKGKMNYLNKKNPHFENNDSSIQTNLDTKRFGLILPDELRLESSQDSVGILQNRDNEENL